MASSLAQEYLAQFAQRAAAAGLELKRPGQNWISAKDLVPGSHVSLSVSRHQIQVNLNNELDADRGRFERLFAQRSALAQAIGRSLAWEKKEGKKKTAVRATLGEGYDDHESWVEQHEWAIETMRRFDREFGRLLAGSQAADELG